MTLTPHKEEEEDSIEDSANHTVFFSLSPVVKFDDDIDDDNHT
tara:strand:+ start:149 stop:277 length:129 start_codon:yes stop_codon:yes gene_type:complete